MWTSAVLLSHNPPVPQSPLSIQLAWVFFVLTLVAVGLSLVWAIVLRPRTRFEWGSVALLAALGSVLVQRLVLWREHRTSLSEPWNAVFWFTMSVLVAVYIAMFVDDKLPRNRRGEVSFTRGSAAMYIGGGVLLLIIVVLLLVWVL